VARPEPRAIAVNLSRKLSPEPVFVSIDLRRFQARHKVMENFGFHLSFLISARPGN